MSLIETMWHDYNDRNTSEDWHRLELMLWGVVIFTGGCHGLTSNEIHDLSDQARARAFLCEEQK